MENKETAPTLPEELVRIHQKVIILQTGNEPKAAKLCTETTLDYMGRFYDWVEHCRAFDEFDRSLTTPQLIQLFFDNKETQQINTK